MPRSLVLYTTEDLVARLREKAGEIHGDKAVKPYTFSFAHPTSTGTLRLRLTELVDNCLAPCLDEINRSGDVVYGAAPDSEVRADSFEEIFEGADAFLREARLQFLSPTLVTLGGYRVPFPVLPLTFSTYIYAWNAHSPKKIPGTAGLFEAIRMTGFKISCARTHYGAAFQGWVDLEMEQGRSEGEIKMFNALCDFAFYCGTGLHVQEGLGQTRRGKPQ
jgi:CRISPR-associated endoribonuclease Cas6